MIKRIYIDNFRCLTNFEINPKACQLWLGNNGSGKTAVLAALRLIQRVVKGDRVDDLVKWDDLTSWEEDLVQHFAIEMQIGDNQYHYQLDIKHDQAGKTCYITGESLKWKSGVADHWGEQACYDFDGAEANLYSVQSHDLKVELNASFRPSGDRSVISTIGGGEDNWPLVEFREAVYEWLIVHPVPAMVDPFASKESRDLSFEMQNFAEWYRHVAQEDMSVLILAIKQLQEVMQPGFESLDMKKWGNARRLTATFQIAGKDVSVPFDKLSDGERQLIMLYVLLETLRKTHPVLIIDEPENFVSLREVGAWMSEAEEICDDNEGRQCIVISHHPSVVNKMARGEEIWFHRPSGEHTITGEFPTCDGLSPAETMRQGIEDE